MRGPVAPKDPVKKKPFFYTMHDKQISTGSDGTTYLYQDCGRMIGSAKIVGNVTDENILDLLKTAEGFKKLVYGIGVSQMNREGIPCKFAFQMYGKTDPYTSGTTITQELTPDGVEYLIPLSEINWSDDDNVPGQIRFEFGKPGLMAEISTCLYLNDGFEAPAYVEDKPLDMNSEAYRAMIARSLMSEGNLFRLQKAIKKARDGEEVTFAAIGGSITQGAGATPINYECYAYKTYKYFADNYGTGDNVHYIKAGVGGTPSELGLLRYDRDVTEDGKVLPDVVIVEFAVNDAGDETEGRAFESLVYKILKAENAPAVIILFSVFADDYVLEDRLRPVGERYNLPMVSLKSAVTEQFYKTADEGRVISKGQYFYDPLHPSNAGHTVMADCICNLLKTASDKLENGNAEVNDTDFDMTLPLYGRDLFNAKLIDIDNPGIGKFTLGSFTERDQVLQRVERNLDINLSPQFPFNAMHPFNAASNEPLVLDIVAKKLFIIYKDSSDIRVGQADVYVDGKLAKHIDPHEVGWVHSNPFIILDEEESKLRHVEVKLQEGDEAKEFTVLGFAYI